MTSTDRKLGRPRDAAVDGAVIQAALEMLDELGLQAVSMDGVAARAGVSKATIYRRWGSREDLLIDAVASLVATVEVPESDDIRADLVTLLVRLRTFMSEMKGGSVFPWLIGEVAAGTEVGRHYAEAVILPRRAMIAQVINRAIQNGSLRPDLDVQLAVDMISGPALLRKMLAPVRGVDEGWEEKLVDALLDGWCIVSS
ncbi:MAG: TetR/AcrR family transcriptional regulator [Actinomycetota bacterium]|nr:TetR/AcrR family transcriptional regulator [Actinomycetota bacterium]